LIHTFFILYFFFTKMRVYTFLMYQEDIVSNIKTHDMRKKNYTEFSFFFSITFFLFCWSYKVWEPLFNRNHNFHR
jgi:hypothetical protein